MEIGEVLKQIKSMSSPEALAGMARFGISVKKSYGVPIPALRKIAKACGKNHLLAGQLWKTGIHDARILAGMIDDPKKVTRKQMEIWVRDFDSWDICDQCCSNLFDKTECAYEKAAAWSKGPEEYVKRAGFALMAALAVHDKEAEDTQFVRFLPMIKRESTDERNFVKKAVNWALRQIGKRNRKLNRAAIKTAKEIRTLDSRPAKWIASDALRELTSDKVQGRLR